MLLLQFTLIFAVTRGQSCPLVAAITSISRKQSLNTRSSTEAELVAAGDAAGPMLWTKQFLQAQGYPVMHNVLYQDNKSAILLEANGRESAGK
jgi:hypothetical protein